MKNFIGLVKEMINGFETTNTVLISARDEKSAETKLNKIVKTWRGGYDWSDNTGYWFDGGGICVNGIIQKEIPNEHAKILAMYI
jgi:hypothetical protein